MSLITCASGKSLWRGIDYFNNKKVSTFECVTEYEYTGTVQGSNGEVYATMIDIAHPRKSKCTCSFADGKRVVCKHMIALYFTVFPDEVEKVYRQAQEAEKEAERYEKELVERAHQCVMRMKKHELQRTVLHLLDYGPEWLFDHFVRMNDLE